MAGPLTTVWYVFKDGFISKSANPPIWIILIGALGLVIGLATYGYKVTRAMGVRLAKISPTRGFAAELATALIITIAAQYGLPTSSSQCITGAIVGVGLLEGTGGVNWKQFGRQFLAWVCTLAAVGLITAAVFSQGIYAPSEIDSKAIISYENRLANISQTIYRDLNTTLYALRTPAQAGQLPRLSASEWSALNSSFTSQFNSAKNLVDVKKIQTVEADRMLATLQRALVTLSNYTIQTLGQTNIFSGAVQCTPNTTAAIQANELGTCRAPTITNRAFKTTWP
jgi:sodium-dependent phosphate transporter